MRRTILSASRPAGKGITDDMVFMWNETLANHRCIAHLSLSKVTVERGRIGPMHDPYAWEEVTFTRNGRTVVLTMCALRGDSLEVDGETVLENVWDGGAVKAVKEYTGISFATWMKAYDRIERNQECDPMGSLGSYV